MGSDPPQINIILLFYIVILKELCWDLDYALNADFRSPGNSGTGPVLIVYNQG